jgi:hypothetical protein
MCLGFTITALWSKMPLMTRKCVISSEVKFVYLLFLPNFYFVNHLNNTKSTNASYILIICAANIFSSKLYLQRLKIMKMLIGFRLWLE